MLVIRKEQMRVFEQVSEDRFVSSLKTHTRRSHMQRCLHWRMSPDEATMLAIERARARGITAGPDIRRVLDTMMLLGPDFHEDPRYPWAERFFARLDLLGPEIVSMLLWEQAKSDMEDRAVQDVAATEGPPER